MSQPDKTGHTSDSGSPASKLLAIINSGWTAQALSVAAQLGIADLLAAGPKTSEQLAQDVGADAGSLRRLLRALTTLETVEEREDTSFALLPMGELLRSDAPESVRAWTILVGRYHWPLWEHLLESVKSGESVRKLVSDTEGFEHLERDPEMAAIFNQAMVELTRLSAPGVVRAYNFSGAKRIVDVGGGYGGLLAVILQANPNVHGVLFDLPHAIAKGRTYLENVGVADRCEFATGNFFESIPRDADTYILKSILHDWNDERSRIILDHCRQALPDDGKLLLVERVMPEHLGTSDADRDVARSDLNMLISLAATERTEIDFRRLLGQSGLQLERIIPVGWGLSILETTCVNQSEMAKR